MEWKDTVVNFDTTILANMNLLIEAQAEFSFRAGRQLIDKERGSIYRDGEQAGIKKVVDWANTEFVYPDNEDWVLGLERKVWQAKLKEWGIE